MRKWRNEAEPGDLWISGLPFNRAARLAAAKVDPLMLDGPKTAPRFAAEFSLKVLLVMRAAVVPVSWMALPSLLAEFPVNVLSMMTARIRPALKMAPPAVFGGFENYKRSRSRGTPQCYLQRYYR
jgi:hypothetical protein